jgi:release factor glutamine methyltransferase
LIVGLIGEAKTQFAMHGIESPQLEAELLLAAALGTTRSQLYLQSDRAPTAGEASVFSGFVEKRIERIPLQYITGEAGFRHLTLQVDSSVLIPRPETEILVEVALELAIHRGGSNVLELGCGSGAIALSLLYESESTRVVATDISAGAIRTASRNAVRYDLDSRMRFVCGDLLRPLREAAHFDMIISNPPYIRSGDLGALEPGVRDYEPRQALDGGVDGLTFYRRIARDAAGLLSAGGQLFLEVGDDQSGEVMEILRESGNYVDVAARKDLNGIPRVVSTRVRRN